MRGLLAGVIAIAVLGLAISRPEGGEPAPTAGSGAPRAATVSSGGSLSHTRSRGGMPIFAASNVGPGTIVDGSVTIANSGATSGYFSLSQADLTDVPGPQGGALSERLRMEVQDVTRPGKPVTVYEGPFAAMDVRPLGFIEPGSTRRYRFSASAPGTEDDSYTGSSASARYVWTAVEGAPRSTPGPPPDRRPPRLQVSIPPVQRLFTRSYLSTGVRCSEACRLGVTGRMRTGRPGTAPTQPLGRRLAPGRDARLRIGLPRPALSTLRGRLLDRKQVALGLDFLARDRAGNRARVKRTVRFKPRR